MMKSAIILLAGCLCLGCSSNLKTVPGQMDTAAAAGIDQFVTNQHEVMGVWTNGNTAKATFKIGKDSIYYVDELKSFKYELTADSIKIHYADFNYAAKIRFIKDTLVMQSQDEGDAKYWRFKK